MMNINALMLIMLKRLRLGCGVAARQERGALSTGLRGFGARPVWERAGTASSSR